MYQRSSRKFPSLNDLFKEATVSEVEEGAETVAATAAAGAPANVAAGAAAADGGTSAPGSSVPQHLGLQPPSSTPGQEQLRMQAPRMHRTWSRSTTRSSGGGSHSDQVSVPRPLCRYDEKVAIQLERRCRAARDMLEALQVPMPAVAGGGLKPLLPSATLRFCKGLAFVKQRKAGLLGGWTWGNGVLIQRVPDGSGWSAPVFLRLHFGSLGATMGAQRVRAVYVLQTAEQVAAFTRGSRTVTLDATMPGDLNPLDVYAPMKAVKQKDLSARPNTNRPHCAMITDGLMWDASVRAGYTYLDEGLNRELYGEEFDLEDVLAGRVAAPPELLPLYQDIEGRAAEAQVTRPTVSKFELARWRSAQHADWSNHGGRAADATHRGARLYADPSGHGSSGLFRGSFNDHSSTSTTISIAHESPSRRGSAAWPSSLAASASPSSGLLAASLGRGSPSTILASAGLAPGSVKLFGDVGDIGFEELHTYDDQEAEEQQAEQQEEHQAEQQAELVEEDVQWDLP